MDLPCSYSSISKCITGIDTFDKWKYVYGVKIIGTSPPYQDSNPGGISKINATIKVLKQVMVVPITHPFNSPMWPVQKSDRFWKMTVDYHGLNQVVTINVAADLDVLSLLK